MIFFPLNLYRSSEHREKATVARKLLDFLGDLHPDVAADAGLFVDGLLRAAISWFEQWILALDAASRAHHEEDMGRMDRILDNLFRSIENPKCDLDRLFVRLHGPAIEQYRRKFEEHTGPAIRSLWDGFKHLFGQLSERVKKLELILLPKVSEELALKRGFKIAVPGTYSVERKVPLLDHIEPALQVLGTQQHPRCVFMVSSDGSKLKFLLKGNEDIRLDERVMQFFTLINSLMSQLRTTRELGAQIVNDAIIPLSEHFLLPQRMFIISHRRSVTCLRPTGIRQWAPPHPVVVNRRRLADHCHLREEARADEEESGENELEVQGDNGEHLDRGSRLADG
jgi:phosphatidylinositol kinase/protein kinase (PI-3  family)